VETSEPKEDKNMRDECFKTDTRAIVSRVAYLIGVEKRHFEAENEVLSLSVFAELEAYESAVIIRALCRLRTAVERNFAAINRLMQSEYKTLYSMTETVPTDELSRLSERGITVVKKSCRQPVDYIIEINRYICDRINNCAELFPMWVEFRYIKELFIMPDGLSVQGTKNAASVYYANRHRYPYQMYINWVPEDSGNILYNDRKFLTLLYRMHGDSFDDISRVSDACGKIKCSIAEFIDSSERTVIVVDCENSDPFKLAAAVRGLPEKTVKGIEKIILYNDVHASAAWRLFDGYCGDIEIEHIMTERVKETKSLVDIKLSCGVSREFYKNKVDSFIIASSDSDYWGLIDSLPEAGFLVMAEREKCGNGIKTALDGRNIFFCYIDDFCTGDIEDYKIAALLFQTKLCLDELVNFNVEVFLDEVVRRTRVHMTDAEYTNFYNKYIRTMQLVIAKNGDVTVEIGSK